MSPLTLGIIGVITMFVLMLLLRVPVPYCMLFVGFIGLWILRGFNAAVGSTVSILYSKFTTYGFSAIPLFIFLGFLAFHSGMLSELFGVAKIWIGHIKGGLPVAGIIGGACFASICGSGAAAGAALSRMVTQELIDAGNDRKISIGSVCAAGTLSPLIPPSVPAMNIAVVLELSIGKVLMGGLLPGIMLALLYCIYVLVVGVIHPEKCPKGSKYTILQKLKATPKIWDFFLLMLIILGGIYFGFVTPTEASALSCAACIIILIIKKRFTFKLLVQALIDTLKTSCQVFFIVSTAFVFGSFMTLTQLPKQFASLITTLQIPPLMVIFAILLFYFIIGMFLEPLPIIYITVPILAPVVSALGYDLIWFAVLLNIMSLVGSQTPPFGNSLFHMKAALGEKVSIKEIYAGSIPFAVISIVGVILCTLIPQIILLIPTNMYG